MKIIQKTSSTTQDNKAQTRQMLLDLMNKHNQPKKQSRPINDIFKLTSNKENNSNLNSSNNQQLINEFQSKLEKIQELKVHQKSQKNIKEKIEKPTSARILFHNEPDCQKQLNSKLSQKSIKSKTPNYDKGPTVSPIIKSGSTYLMKGINKKASYSKISQEEDKKKYSTHQISLQQITKNQIGNENVHSTKNNSKSYCGIKKSYEQNIQNDELDKILRQIFNQLDSDEDGLIDMDRIEITTIEVEVLEIIQKVLFKLEESVQSYNFKQFCKEIVSTVDLNKLMMLYK